MIQITKVNARGLEDVPEECIVKMSKPTTNPSLHDWVISDECMVRANDRQKTLRNLASKWKRTG